MRDSVRFFAEAMEEKLKLNDHKGGWENMDCNHLTERLLDEVAEMKAALTPESCMAEAIDVANFVMMIWDIARAQKEKS